MDCDVLIAGAGPTGLMLAYELRLAGVSTVVLERDLERTRQSKALNLQPRTAEVLDLRGLLGSLQEKAFAQLGGGHFAGLPQPLHYEGWRTRYPYQVGVRQAHTEEALEAAVADSVWRGYELDALTQYPDHVRVRCGDRELSARYLVAADGGRSMVRKLLGTPFDGRDARIQAVVADVTLARGAELLPRRFTDITDGGRRTDVSLRRSPAIPLGDGVYRVSLMGEAQQRAGRDEPVTHEEVRAGFAELYGDDIELAELVAGSRFGDTSRQVRNYRQGRVFYAGDAAHIHFPAGGQGLNLGVQDAFNLGWKLGAVLRGEAGESLLDSYHAERHPVGHRVLHNTRAQGALMELAEDPDGAALRETFTTLMGLPQANDYLAGMVSGLDITYPVDCGHELAGSRLLDYDLADCGRAYQRMHGGEWLVLRAHEVPELPAEAALVRPDGHVHWAGAESELADAMATRFGERTVAA